MKLRTLALASVAALALSVPAMANGVTGWYLGLEAGWAAMQDLDAHATVPYTPGTYDTKLEADGGFLVGGMFGYRFDNNFRLEDEIAYASNDVKDTNVTGSVHIASDFVNVLYDHPLTDRLDFVVGGGIGLGKVAVKAAYGGATLFDETKLHFGAQGIVGFKYWLSDYTDFGVEYRYRAFFSDTDGACGTGCTATVEAPTQSIVMASLRFYLTPPPPPPPPPPPCSKTAFPRPPHPWA